MGNLTGTTNQISVSNGTGAIIGTEVNLSLPQNIHTGASPTFAGLTANGSIHVTGDLTVDGQASFVTDVIVSNQLGATNANVGNNFLVGGDVTLLSGVLIQNYASKVFVSTAMLPVMGLPKNAYADLGHGNILFQDTSPIPQGKTEEGTYPAGRYSSLFMVMVQDVQNPDDITLLLRRIMVFGLKKTFKHTVLYLQHLIHIKKVVVAQY